jgi:putative glycosyltransferase (TIGR04372 family)
MTHEDSLGYEVKRVTDFKQRVIHFISWQVKQIQEEGAPALYRKFGKVAGGLLAVIPVIFVRLIRPLILVRFGVLNSHRIGHFSFDVEMYLCEREVGLQNKEALDFFGYGEFICNAAFKTMCERVLTVVSFAKHCDRLNRLLPGGETHTVSILSNAQHDSRDVQGLLLRTKPHVNFTEEEERRGHRALPKLGVPAGSDFVCFHARDSSYLKTIYPRWDCSYHDHRDTTVQTYLSAAEELASRGIYTLRMGAVVDNKLHPTNPKVIDYATQGRTDFLDIYLSSHCRFFLASCSGIDSIATIFRRPVVYTNLIPLEYAPSWDPTNLFIPKKLWLVQERRFLNFREIFERNLARVNISSRYLECGIEVVENTADEIRDVALEMDDRLRGTWVPSGEDDELQKRFWSLFKPSHLHGRFLSRVGAIFLRQNRALLD